MESESQSRKNVIVLEPRLESGEVARYFSKVSSPFYDPALTYRWNRIGVSRKTDFGAFKIFGKDISRKYWDGYTPPFSDRYNHAVYLFDGGIGLRESKDKKFDVYGGICVNIHITDMEHHSSQTHTLEINSESIRWGIKGIDPTHGEGYSVFPIQSNNLVMDYQIMSILANSHSLHSQNGLFCEDALREVKEVVKDYDRLRSEGVIQDHNFDIPKITKPHKFGFIGRYILGQKETSEEQESRKNIKEFYGKIKNLLGSYKIGEERHERAGFEYPLGHTIYIDYFQKFSVDDFIYKFLAANGELFMWDSQLKDSLERRIYLGHTTYLVQFKAKVADEEKKKILEDLVK